MTSVKGQEKAGAANAPDLREAHRTIEEVVGVLSPRTEKDYRQVVERWKREGQPDPVAWVAERSSEATRRNARAGLIWYHRVELGRTLDIPWVRPLQRPVPHAFSVEELAVIREEALGVHARCRPVLDLLYSTGARLAEAWAITLEDVTDTHVVLRNTKRRPGGLQVHRRYGYRLVRNGNGKNRYEAVPEEQEVITLMRAMRDGQATLQAIADRLNADGTPTASGTGGWNASRARKVLRREQVTGNQLRERPAPAR